MHLVCGAKERFDMTIRATTLILALLLSACSASASINTTGDSGAPTAEQITDAAPAVEEPTAEAVPMEAAGDFTCEPAPADGSAGVRYCNQLMALLPDGDVLTTNPIDAQDVVNDALNLTYASNKSLDDALADLTQQYTTAGYTFTALSQAAYVYEFSFSSSNDVVDGTLIADCKGYLQKGEAFAQQSDKLIVTMRCGRP